MKNSKIFTLSLLLFAIVSACEQPWEEPFKIYTMKKGKHESTFKVTSLQSEALVFKAKFDETAKYKTQTEENQHDLNKLMGFSDCNSLHHANSARFGWRWLNDTLEIHAYCYVNGQRTSQYIGAVEIGQEAYYSLQVTNDQYIFNLNEEEVVTIDRGDVCNVGIYYMLWPYFGGDETAPHDVHVYIRTLY